MGFNSARTMATTILHLADLGCADGLGRALSDPPPGAVPLQFAEWSLANSLTDSSYGIHHPAGTFKRITFFEPSSYLLCTVDSGDDGDYFLANATNGAIEGGSSGSGLFDHTGKLIGHLNGECGPGIEKPGNCSDQDGWRAVYGKFWVSYGSAASGAGLRSVARFM
jgi:lysyl endopeptidase